MARSNYNIISTDKFNNMGTKKQAVHLKDNMDSLYFYLKSINWKLIGLIVVLGIFTSAIISFGFVIARYVIFGG